TKQEHREKRNEVQDTQETKKILTPLYIRATKIAIILSVVYLICYFVVGIQIRKQKKNNEERKEYIYSDVSEEYNDNSKNYIEQEKEVYNYNEDVGDLSSNIIKAKPITSYGDNVYIDEVDSVYFGHDKIGASIEWIVLEKNERQALLLSKEIIENQVYGTLQSRYYSDSYLRSFLVNNLYDDIFDEKEKRKIQPINIDGNYETIFILSYVEALKYFGNEINENKKAATRISKYLKETRTDITISESNGAWHYGNSSYWLRDLYGDKAMYVGYSGRINVYGDDVTINDGIRPAIWVSLYD
ncbi:MAG: hypothetical protein J6O09_03030, partial [Lachnospiraceae bacterium]|nr:hypothetical protein [Lachnospiraceae bacterium]